MRMTFLPRDVENDEHQLSVSNKEEGDVSEEDATFGIHPTTQGMIELLRLCGTDKSDPTNVLHES